MKAQTPSYDNMIKCHFSLANSYLSGNLWDIMKFRQVFCRQSLETVKATAELSYRYIAVWTLFWWKIEILHTYFTANNSFMNKRFICRIGLFFLYPVGLHWIRLNQINIQTAVIFLSQHVPHSDSQSFPALFVSVSVSPPALVVILAITAQRSHTVSPLMLLCKQTFTKKTLFHLEAIHWGQLL